MKNSSQKPEVSVIIPNWNGYYLIKICLKALEKQTYKNFEVIVIDNGSTDMSLDFIKKNYPKVTNIKLKVNTGFANAVNLGIKQARGKYLLLLNNDTEIEKNCLSYLVKCFKKKKNISFICPKILNFYERDKIDSAGDWIDEVGHADNIGRGEKDDKSFSKERPVFIGTAGGCLIKREAFKKVGLFDEDYFMYFEDVDWCFRAQLLGLKGWYEPKAIIYHVHKGSASRVRSLVEYLQFRNMTMTVIKNFPKGLLLYRMNWMRIIWVNLNTIRFIAKQGFLKEALRAEAYILINFVNILKKRQKIQSKKLVSDQYIIENVRRKKLTLFGIFPKGI